MAEDVLSFYGFGSRTREQHMLNPRSQLQNVESRPEGFAKRGKRLQGGQPFLSLNLFPLSVRNTKFNKQKIELGSLLYPLLLGEDVLSPGTQ